MIKLFSPQTQPGIAFLRCVSACFERLIFASVSLEFQQFCKEQLSVNYISSQKGSGGFRQPMFFRGNYSCMFFRLVVLFIQLESSSNNFLRSADRVNSQICSCCILLDSNEQVIILLSVKSSLYRQKINSRSFANCCADLQHFIIYSFSIFHFYAELT